jgi:hypothetical protein
VINVSGAPAGTYFILVDTVDGNEGAYGLSVVPAPGSMALVGMGLLFGARRRRVG